MDQRFKIGWWIFFSKDLAIIEGTTNATLLRCIADSLICINIAINSLRSLQDSSAKMHTRVPSVWLLKSDTTFV